MREQHADLTGPIDRRGFLGTSAGAVAAATLAEGAPAAAQTTTASPPAVLPKRPLGRTGVQVTILISAPG